MTITTKNLISKLNLKRFDSDWIMIGENCYKKLVNENWCELRFNAYVILGSSKTGKTYLVAKARKGSLDLSSDIRLHFNVFRYN